MGSEQAPLPDGIETECRQDSFSFSLTFPAVVSWSRREAKKITFSDQSTHKIEKKSLLHLNIYNESRFDRFPLR